MKVCIAGVSRYSPFTTTAQQAAPVWGSFLTHAEVAKRFEEFDLDQDGIITVDECRAAMDRLEREISDGVVRESMWTWDSNKDGIVDYFEFMDHFLSTAPADEHADCSHDSGKQFESIEALLKHCTITESTSVAGTLSRSAKMELIKSFKLIDLDNDGFLSREELDLALKGMSPNSSSIERNLSLDHIFDIADKNSDGLIDLYEFSSKVVQNGLYS
jgi:Ca2+-binding EF-hand superfamily protein